MPSYNDIENLEKEVQLKELQLKLADLEAKLRARDRELDGLSAMQSQFVELEANQQSYDEQVIARAAQLANDAFTQAELAKKKRELLAKLFTP